jgi:hypothetical protein
MWTIDKIKNNEKKLKKKLYCIIYNKFIIINIINLENNVAQLLGPICTNK